MAASRDKILREAEKLVQRGKVEQAIREYEKLLKESPRDANTINRVGDLYGRVGQIDKAVELYQRIAEHFAKDGFTTKAIAIFKKINRLAPHRLDIFERLAELYIQQGLIVEAKSQYQVLADWYIKNGDQPEAVATHKKLVQLDPNNHMAHLRLADLLMSGGAAEDAIHVYERLGRVLLERGKLEEAERLYRHALDQNPPNGQFLAPLCEALLDSGRGAAAREFLHAAMQRSPDSRALQLLEVRTLLAFGESDKALERARALLAGAPDDAPVQSLVARALLSAGKVDEARESLLPLCEGLLDRGEFGAAQKLLQELLDSVPHDQKVLALAVRAYRPSGDQQRLAELQSALADTYYQSEQLGQAQRLYVELLESQPRNDQIRQRLARIHESEPELAHPVAVPAPDRTPEPIAAPAQPLGTGPLDAEERLAEARVFAKYGLLEKATSHLEEIIRWFPDKVEARAILVSLYVEQGEKEAALVAAGPLYEHYRRASDHEAVQALLASLPELQGRGPAPATSVADIGDDVIVLDLDEAMRSPSPPVAGVSATAAAVGERARTSLQPEEVEEPEVAQPEDELIIDLDAELEPLEIAVQPIESRTTATPAPIALSGEDEEVEELVDISANFAGPSLVDVEQLDFFIEQDLHEDAIRMLGKLESEFRDDPQVVERRLALKAKGVLLEDVVAVSDEPAGLFADEEESYIDLAKELELEMAEEEAMVDEATGRGKEEALLEEVFREFQKGVAEQLSEADTDTHFNLGIAYKEMGLLPEAIREFQVASRDDRLFVECCSLVGVCYMDQGMWSQAAEWYDKALGSANLTEDAHLALRYDLATALAAAGDNDRALDLYEEVATSNPHYRDVSARLSSLDAHRHVN